MQVATVRAVIERIEAEASRSGGGAVAFDGDGTLWAGDIGEDFFVALLEHGLHDVAREALAREAAEAKLDSRGSARDLAHRIHLAYLGNAFPEERVCEIMTWAAAGWSRADLERFSAEVLIAERLEQRFHEEAVRIVQHLARRTPEIPVFVVSASPRAIVEPAVRRLGIPAERVVAARECADGAGIVTCAVERPIPYGSGKVVRLREKIGSRPLHAAFGDNAFDVPMLKEAELAVAIRPKERLLDRAGEVQSLVVLERLERPT